MKTDVDESDGDRSFLRIGFFPIKDPTAKFPITWPIFRKKWRPPVFPERPIEWWDSLYVGYIVDDTTFWCNDFTVSYIKDIIQYDHAKLMDTQYEVGNKWYTGEQVGWMYALYTMTNILTSGLSSFAWSEDWLDIFNHRKYHARHYVRVVEYRWRQDITLSVAVDCDGIVTEYDKKAYPTDRPPDTEGRITYLTQEFYGNPTRGDPDPLNDSWIGDATGAVEKAAEFYEGATGMPFSPTVTVMSPGETIVTPIEVKLNNDTPPLNLDGSLLELQAPEELLTSYQIVVELNDPDGATAIAAYPSGQQYSNVDVALKGSFVAGPYTHPGYTIDQLRTMQANGTPISRDDFQNTFGITLPAGVSECIITGIDIDTDTRVVFGDTTYQPGIYVWSDYDKFSYPSSIQEGTITVVHR